jgi:hypothetical protein
MLVAAACFSVCEHMSRVCASQAALVKVIHVRLFSHYAEL